MSPIKKTEREGIIFNKKNLKVLCREGLFFIHGRTFFCTRTPLYYTISPIKTEREGVIYNKGFV
jgi:hypothetical protein